MRINVGKSLLTVLLLSPLLYSADGDPLRKYQVAVVASLSTLIILLRGQKLRRQSELTLVATYGMWMIAQQLIITDGNVFFAIKYAIMFAAMFVPMVAIRNMKFRSYEFSDTINRAFSILSIISILSIVISYTLQVGEVYVENGARRAFAWLGDSYTPVLVYLAIFAALQKRYATLAGLISALLMTGGKAAIGMLLCAPLLNAAMKRGSPKLWRRAGLSTAAAIGVLAWNWEVISREYLSHLEYSFFNRTLANQLGINYFIKNPIAGIGINRSSEAVMNESQDIIANRDVSSYELTMIGNSFVRTAAEMGLVGLAILVALSIKWITDAAITLRSLPRQRSTIVNISQATSLWIVLFICLYQTTGWFIYGHPQLAWLVLAVGISNQARLLTRGQS